MKVILDTNVVIADYRLNNPNSKVLLEAAKKGDVEIIIPELVLDEIRNKYRQHLSKSIAILNSKVDDITKKTGREVDSKIGKRKLELFISEYNKFLEELIDELNINTIEYPIIDHKIIAAKAIQRKKPFKENGSGYRDSLIWENVKSLLSPFDETSVTPELVFISNNKSDFYDGEKSKLHPELMLELEEEGYLKSSIRVYKTLNDFNEDIGKLFFAQADSFGKKLFDKDNLDFDLKSELNEFLHEHFVGSELTKYDSNGMSSHDDYTVSTFDDANYSLELDSVKKLNSKEYLVDISTILECEVDFFLDKYDALSTNDKSITIQDANWNNYVMWVSKDFHIDLNISLIIDSELNISSIEINEIDIL